MGTVYSPKILRVAFTLMVVAGLTFGGTNLALAAENKCELSANNSIENCDYSGQDLRDINLVGKSITYSNFEGAILDRANLSYTNLTGSSFRNAQLNGVVFNTTDLTDADFTGVRGTSITYFQDTTLPKDWVYRGGYLFGPTANLSGQTFIDTFVMDGLNLEGANFSHARFNGIKMQGTNFSRSNFYGAKFQSCNLSQSSFESSEMTATDLNYSYAISTNFSNTSFLDSNFYGSNLNSANFSDANLSGASQSSSYFYGTNFHNAKISSWFFNNNYGLSGNDFSGAFLNGMNFGYRNLQGSNFAGASLRYSYFYRSDLSNVDFSGADLSNSNLQHTTITDTDFTNANFYRVKAVNVSGSTTKLPSEWRQVGTFLAGPYADLDYVEAPGSNLSNLNLTGATLRNSQLWYSDFSNSNLSNTDLSIAYLGSSNFRNTNFDRALLYGTEISQGDFTGANLNQVRGARLSCGQSVNLPSPWRCLSGMLIGPGADLHGTYWAQAGFVGVDLSNANLRDSQFYLTSFTDSKLEGADFSGSHLSNAEFFRSDFEGASISGARADQNTRFVNSNLKNADLSNLQCNSCSFSGSDLSNSNFKSATLQNANFESSDLTNSNFSNAYLQSAKFIRANLSGVKSGGIWYSWGTTFDPGWSVLAGYIVGPGASLSYGSFYNQDFSRIDLTNMDLTFADLRLADFKNSKNFRLAKIQGANFSSANLSGLDLSGLDLSDMDFSSANLENANLTGANLQNSNLSGARLNGAILTGAKVEGANLSGAALSRVISGGLLGKTSALPDKWNLVAGYLVGPEADLRKADLSNQNLTGQDFTGANLTEANLKGSSLEAADFTNSVLTRLISGSVVGVPLKLPASFKFSMGYVLGPEVNLRGENLRGLNLENLDLSQADLSGADLSNANLSNAKFTQADLTGANLSGSLLAKADFTLTNLTRSNLSASYLASARFTGTNLPLVRLDDAYIGNAGLCGVSNPTGISSGGVLGTPSCLPGGYVLEKGYLVGPRANLQGADLSNAQLAKVNLDGANLVNANLRGAQLSSSIISGAQISNADFSGARLVDANLDGLVGDGANFVAADISCTDPCAASKLNLTKTNFTSANLKGRNLLGSSATESIFDYAELSSSYLNSANFSTSSFTGANLSDAWLLYSQLENSSLFGTNLSRTRMQSSSLDGVSSSGIVGLPIGLPDQWRLVGGRLIGPNASGGDFSELSIVGADDSQEVSVGMQLGLTLRVNSTGANLSYQWQKDGNPILGANDSSYVVRSSDWLSEISALITIQRPGSTATTFVSAPVRVVKLAEFAPLTNTSASGADSIGSQLKVQYSGKGIDSVIKTEISLDNSNWKAVDANYAPNLEDLGKTVKVRLLQSQEGYATQITELGVRQISSVISGSPCPVAKFEQGIALSAPTLSGEARYGSRLTGSVGSWTNGTKTCFFWLVNDKVKANQSGLVYRLGASEVDQKLRFVVVAKLPNGNFSMTASAEALVRKLEFTGIQKPQVSGVSRVGRSIKVVPGSNWPRQTTFNYQWLRNGVEIEGATKQTLLLGSLDSAKSISVRICGSKQYFESACSESEATLPIELGVISPMPTPRIVGSPLKVGSVLSVNTGTLMSGVTLSYQWFRDGIAIAGENKASRIVDSLDRGSVLTVEVVVAKPGYRSISKLASTQRIN